MVDFAQPETEGHGAGVTAVATLATISTVGRPKSSARIGVSGVGTTCCHAIDNSIGKRTVSVGEGHTAICY